MQSLIARLVRTSPAHIILAAFALWLTVLLLIAFLPILQDTGAKVFMYCQLAAPTAVTLLLYTRSLLANPGLVRNLRAHLPWLLTLGVVVWMGVDTWKGNPNGSDLAWGLRFEMYQFNALLWGCAAWWISGCLIEEIVNRPRLALAAAGLFISLVLALVVLHHRNVQKEWPTRQWRNAMALAKALDEYRDSRGAYPENLTELVDARLMTEARFRELQFKRSPRDQSEAWLYRRPDHIDQIAIAAPHWIITWDGHSGQLVTARADGGGEIFTATKVADLPKWVQDALHVHTELETAYSNP